MNKLLGAATMAVTLLIATSAQANFFSSFSTSDWPTKESSAFKVESYGYDFRVYEWQSEANPNVTCTAGFTDTGAIGMQCFETVTPVNPAE